MHSFGDAAAWKSLDHSGIEMETDSKRLSILPRKITVLKHSGSLASARAGSWRPWPIQTLPVIGFLAFLGVTFVILVQNIHLPPDRRTLEKDAAELACLETQSRTNDYHTEMRSVPLAAADSAAIGRFDLLLEQQSQSEASKSALIASRASSPDLNQNTDSSSVKKQLRPFKRDLARRGDHVRNPQRERSVSSTRQRHEQKGPSSLFAGLWHALGFSSN
jgi:hypothetical protein